MKKIFKNMMKILVFFFSWAILGGLIGFPSNNPAIWRFGAEFIPFLIIAVLSYAFWLVERKNLSIINWKNTSKILGLGLVAGTLWICLPILILYLWKVIAFDNLNKVTMLPLWLLACIFNVMLQELLVRGYIYQLLKKEYHLTAAAIFTTVLFTVFHGGAFEAGIVPVLCVITMSLTMTAALEYSESLVLPIVLHSIWNCVGAIIFNVVGLADDYPHIVNAEFHGKDVLTGGSSLMEGSIIVLIINIIYLTVFIFLTKRKLDKSQSI